MRDAEAEAALDKRHRRLGEFVDGMGKGVVVASLEGGALVSVKVRFPTEEEPSTLLIVRVLAEKGPLIGFVGAYGMGDALLALRARVLGKGVKWREDVPWGQR